MVASPPQSVLSARHSVLFLITWIYHRMSGYDLAEDPTEASSPASASYADQLSSLATPPPRISEAAIVSTLLHKDEDSPISYVAYGAQDDQSAPLPEGLQPPSQSPSAPVPLSHTKH